MKQKPGLRMKELTQATGAPKSTILYYLEQGLLPRPVKTSRNMAFYDPVCVERIKLIKELQANHRLSLEEIKGLLKAKEEGAALGPALELRAAIFGKDSDRRMNRRELARESGLSPEEIDKCVELELLLPIREKGFDAGDLAVAQMLALGKEAGIPLNDLAFYPVYGRKIAEHEMALRNRRVEGLNAGEWIDITLQMMEGAKVYRSYIMDRMLRRLAIASDEEDEPCPG